jgi:hypothetical protein
MKLVKKGILLVGLICLSLTGYGQPDAVRQVSQPSSAGNAGREETQAMQAFREGFAKAPYRLFKNEAKLDVARSSLTDEGRFSDLSTTEGEDFQAKIRNPRYVSQGEVSIVLGEAFSRIWRLAETLRGRQNLSPQENDLREKLFKAIEYYGCLETSRPNVPSRFHVSCFAIPLAAANTYFCFFPLMQSVEDGGAPDKRLAMVHDLLLTLGFQAWTVPARGDETDGDVVSVERFRHHVMWVGGNALAYRPLLPVAAMMRSAPMMQVLSEVALGALSATSYSTRETSFWSEGMTEDGAGWGHGRQNQVFGYPMDGVIYSLDILASLKGTPWEKDLGGAEIEALMNYLKGSSFFFYKGTRPPLLSRQNMVYGFGVNEALTTIPLVSRFLKEWRDDLSSGQAEELSRLAEGNTAQPGYEGVRYFWNQDILISKAENYYFIVSMSSPRSHGLESVRPPSIASGYNLFTDDGQTLLYRDGKEYAESLGGWLLTAVPGVTARQGEVKPVTNWRGYNNRINLSGGVARGINGCAGFVFEKQNAASEEGSEDAGGADDPNPIIYGVKACKSWFMMGNAILALGAGITDLRPELPGPVWTTINQSSWRGAVKFCGESGALSITEPNGQRHEWRIESDTGKKRAAVVFHDGFTYGILPEYTTGEIHLLLERRPTRWAELAGENKNKKTPSEADIFQLWIDHGAHPREASYAWFAVADSDMTKIAEAPPIMVLANTPMVQAARSRDGRIVQAVFHAANASLDIGKDTISVNTPCVLMLEQTESEWIVTASDSEQLRDKTGLRLSTTARLSGESVSFEDGRSILAIPLPQEPMLGAATVMRIPLAPR